MLSSLHAPSEIKPRLWLSGVRPATNAQQLSTLRVTHILSVVETQPRYPSLSGATDSASGESQSTELQKLHIPLQDVEDADILQHLDATTAYIQGALESDERNVLLVHCAKGHSRSATVVCAFLMATTGLSADEAIAFVASKRQFVCPNPGFRRQLDQYSVRLIKERKKRRSAAPEPSLSF
ncbi:protein-tyrosine phosphatase-like protein [Daedaleopsis nitida]|nr:protein-tyrosine phosphatase-like protein [Daedaleopsis nitida]